MEIDWESTCLQDLLLRDRWNPYHGIGFIAGFNFSDASEHRKATNNDLLYWLAKNDEFYFMDCYVTLTRLNKLWNKSVQSELLECTPEFLINWAIINTNRSSTFYTHNMVMMIRIDQFITRTIITCTYDRGKHVNLS